MPGRGAVWRIGGLKDKHVLEEDLSQALQTKVNTGGGGGSGNVETVLDTTFGSDAVSHSFNLSRSVAMDGTDVGELIIIFSELTLSAEDIIDIQFNGESFNTGGTRGGITSDGFQVDAFSLNFITDGIDMPTDSSGSIIIEIPGDLHANGNDTGAFGRWSDKDHWSEANITLGSSAYNPMVSIQIRTRGLTETLNSASRVVVYAVNKD